MPPTPTALDSALIDPELAVALDALPKADNGKLLDLSDIPAQRAAMQADLARLPKQQPDPRITVETVAAQRADGSTLDIVLFTPVGAGDALPALLYFHPGGQVFISAHDDIAYPTALALAVTAAVAVVDYRLAPETPAPGAAEDGYLAYTHVLAHADDHRIRPDRIGLAGASGGGAIAAATALMIRDRHIAQPRLLSLNYAMLDDRNETPSSRQVTDVGIWDRQENVLAWTAVLGDRAAEPDVHPYCAPGRATDLRGLPETFVAAAQFDVFRDEDIDFAARLMAAGVPVDLHVYAHAYHAWDFFAPTSRLTEEFEQTWHAYLRRRLHG